MSDCHKVDYRTVMDSVCVWIFVALGLAVFGCEGKKKDNWYEDSSIKKSDEKSYIRDQMMMGVSREDAQGTYNRNVFWEATEGKNQKTVLEGDELETKLSQP